MTHWVTSLAIVALVISGYVITMTHPHLYWGDAGNLEMTAWITLPIERRLGESGWGRSLHFLGAWILALTGLIDVFWGWPRGTSRATCSRAVGRCRRRRCATNSRAISAGASTSPVRHRTTGLKYLSTITAVDRLDNVEDGKGSGGVAAGYAWYAGI